MVQNPYEVFLFAELGNFGIRIPRGVVLGVQTKNPRFPKPCGVGIRNRGAKNEITLTSFN